MICHFTILILKLLGSKYICGGPILCVRIEINMSEIDWMLPGLKKGIKRASLRLHIKSLTIMKYTINYDDKYLNWYIIFDIVKIKRASKGPQEGLTEAFL